MDTALAKLGYLRFSIKDYIWGQNENRSLMTNRIKEGSALLFGESRHRLFYTMSKLLRDTVHFTLPNQKKISALEQKEVIDDPLLEQVAKLLKVPADAIKNFDEEAAINVIGNNYHDNSTSNVNYHCTFNPIDKIIELYDALVKSEKEKNELLQKLLDERK
jgi:hypothetical protein